METQEKVPTKHLPTVKVEPAVYAEIGELSRHLSVRLKRHVSQRELAAAMLAVAMDNPEHLFVKVASGDFS